MEFRDGSASNEHQELHKSAIEGAHHLSVSSLRISPKSSKSPNSPRSPRSPSSPSVPKSPRSPIIPKSPRSPSVPKSPRSPRVHGKGSPLKNDRHSHSLIDGRPKKGKLYPFEILLLDWYVIFFFFHYILTRQNL